MNKKGNLLIISGIMIAVAFIAIIGAAMATNGNGIYNVMYEDVKSGTDVAPTCEPKKYLVELSGSLDLINQKQATWSLDYDIDFIDANIKYINLAPLGIFDFTSSEFTAEVCIYDVLANADFPEKIECQTISDRITYGQFEKYPFLFRYNLYDNDCNGEVDDHTLNLVVTLKTEDEINRYEKTVAITGGQAIFQNAKY